MFQSGPSKGMTLRLNSLQEHLREEHPVLLDVVPTYLQLDKLLYRMGLLGPDDSLATRITWWPLIAVLGTFSAGKSTFINHYLDEDLQTTGNQAVDDKFTVICYGPDTERRVLPGTALDADPRFPFFRMSDEIDKVAAGEGKRIDSYLQLKTTPSLGAKGRILIDSPGFDADDQRRSTLRLTDHILHLADLVLVLFDARHPEPGAMQDTLEHLVKSTVKRADSPKFLYILNQIDTAAREDNPEEVIAAWQRAISGGGLSAGRFYCIYNDRAAVPFPDEARRIRFQAKRDKDLNDISKRIRDVEVERSYRIVSTLETVTNELEQEVVPALSDALEKWRQRTLIGDGLAAALVGMVFAALYFGLDANPLAPLWTLATGSYTGALVGLVVVFALAMAVHYWVRGLSAKSIARDLSERFGLVDMNLRAAFLKNTRMTRSALRAAPIGWGRGARKKLKALREACAGHVQRLNDLYTDPSGRRQAAAEAAALAEVPNDPALALADPVAEEDAAKTT